jgi:hypothetical protein
MGGLTFRPPRTRGTKISDGKFASGADSKTPAKRPSRTRGGHMQRLNTPLSDCRVYSWTLLSVTDAK